MLDLPELTPWQTILLLVAASGAVSWGLTRVLKLALDGWLKARPSVMPPWFYDAALRFCSIMFGAASGFAMMRDAVGLQLGAGAGALNTLLVWVLKKRARSLAGDTSHDNDPTSPPA